MCFTYTVNLQIWIEFFLSFIFENKKGIAVGSSQEGFAGYIRISTISQVPILIYNDEFLIAIIIILHAKMTIITWVIVKAGDDAGRHSGILQPSFLVLRSRVENTAL